MKVSSKIEVYSLRAFCIAIFVDYLKFVMIYSERAEAKNFLQLSEVFTMERYCWLKLYNNTANNVHIFLFKTRFLNLQQSLNIADWKNRWGCILAIITVILKRFNILQQIYVLWKFSLLSIFWVIKGYLLICL